MNKEELEEIKEEITLYKKWRDVVTNGRFYRGRNFFNHGSVLSATNVAGSKDEGNVLEWTYVTNTKDRAVGMVLVNQNVPNMSYEYYKPCGLKEDAVYRFSSKSYKHNIKLVGSLVNVASPVHIKQGSIVQEIASKFVKLDENGEEYIATGETLNNSGVKIKQSFAATGINDNTRLFTDYSARMYFMEELDLQ
jgi:alpha-galactosidase